MKKLLLILMPFTCYNVMGQFDGSNKPGEISAIFRAGYNVSWQKPVFGAGIEFEAHGLALIPEMIVYSSKEKPVLFGLKLSYERNINDTWSVQVGAGRYFELYSTDAYDKYKNGWSSLFFGTVHYDKWFAEYNYTTNGSIISIGVRESLAFLQ